VPDVVAGRRLVAAELAPLLERLNRERVGAGRWWFLVKHDGAAHVGCDCSRRTRRGPATRRRGGAGRSTGRRAVCSLVRCPVRAGRPCSSGARLVELAHDLMHRDSVAAARWLAGEWDHTRRRR